MCPLTPNASTVKMLKRPMMNGGGLVASYPVGATSSTKRKVGPEVAAE